MMPILIRVPEDRYELYKEYSREKGVSLAEFFRKAADSKMGLQKKRNPKYSVWDLGTKFVVKGGPKDSSINFDKYLYEDGK